MTSPITAALIGNPNTGKTSLFNALTGLSHKVGNYPGVTIERKSGILELPIGSVELIDLPGTYSLAARSPDEMIVVDILLGQQKGEKPLSLILSILDASNLDRNLYLLSQLSAFDIPIVGVLNMKDIAAARGIKIDLHKLESRLGIPIVPTRADKADGIAKLLSTVNDVLQSQNKQTRPSVPFPPAVVDALAKLNENFPAQEALRVLVDKDGYAEKRAIAKLGHSFSEELTKIRSGLTPPETYSALEAKARYKWIREVTASSVFRPAIAPRTSSDRIDTVLTHKVWGTVILLGVLAVMFQAIYAWAQPMMKGIESGIQFLSNLATASLHEGAIKSLIENGVFGGAGSVLVFLPQILILFFFISILEDCGYMARAAFLVDRLLGTFGLSGKSVIPLLSSFACAVPGIMSTRTIENPRERLLTILVSPLMSCSARLPVYILMIAAFVPNQTYWGGWVNLKGLALLAMHLLGVLVAAPTIWFIKKTLLRMQALPFIMELPTYKWPAPRVVLQRLYFSGREFIVRAGTIICLVSIVVWVLSYFPRSLAIETKYKALQTQAQTVEQKTELEKLEAGENLRHSIMGRLGQFVEPVVKPLGWDWRIGMAAIASFPAREVVIATLGTIFNLGTGEDENSKSLSGALQEATKPDGTKLFSLSVALSVMVFFALCCQCAATLATIRRETNSIKWPVFAFTYMTVLAYIGSFSVYQITHSFGW